MEVQMTRRAFFVRSIWDDEAHVYVSESDIFGLHIETKTIEEFEEVLFDAAADLVMANHVSPDDLANKPLRDIMPAIVWERPLQAA
jgi:hypothetical protein